MFRLYPLHFVALLLAACAVFLLPIKDCAMLMNAECARETLTHEHHNARQWVHQALLISGGMDTTFANPPIWTLAAEMRISLIFPVVAFVVARTGLVTSGILTALGFLLGPWMASKTIATVGMIPLFSLGAFTAQWMSTVPTSQRSGLWVMLPGLVLYSAAAWMGRDLLGKEAPFYVAGLGSAIMIAAIVRHPRLARPFSTPVLVRLGQLSDGVYLLHFPLLLAETWAVERAGASGQMILPCLVVATLLLSWVLFRTVEKPFIALGLRYARRTTAKHAGRGCA